MSDAKNTVGMLILGIINVLSCYIAGFMTYKHGKKLNVNSKTPWCLLQLSYGTMPFFGLWDSLIRISKYDNRDMNGLSSFFSVMTLMFLVSATLIDNKICNISWNIKHMLIYMFIIIPFWLILFLVPALDTIAYSVYPLCMLPIALPAATMIIYYLHKLNILCGTAGFLLLMSLLFSVLGFVSLKIWDKDNSARMFGWYIFCWLSVILLYILWTFVHVVKKLDNDNFNATFKDNVNNDTLGGNDRTGVEL
eukprot:524453_1